MPIPGDPVGVLAAQEGVLCLLLRQEMLQQVVKIPADTAVPLGPQHPCINAYTHIINSKLGDMGRTGGIPPNVTSRKRKGFRCRRWP